MIKNHQLEVKINFIKCKDIVKGPSYPSLDPHPVKYLFEIGPPVEMLIRSLDPGKLSSFAQFETFGSSRLAFSIFWKASIKGVLEGTYLVEGHRIKTVLTKFSTQVIWFEKFVGGVELLVVSKSRLD